MYAHFFVDSFHFLDKTNLIEIIKSYPPDLDDNLIKILNDDKYQLLWIFYEEFEDVRQIGKGGFATVHCAGWPDKGQNVRINVALKIIDNSEDHKQEFMSEVNY